MFPGEPHRVVSAVTRESIHVLKFSAFCIAALFLPQASLSASQVTTAAASEQALDERLDAIIAPAPATLTTIRATSCSARSSKSCRDKAMPSLSSSASSSRLA
jgi:hypothetical protein